MRSGTEPAGTEPAGTERAGTERAGTEPAGLRLEPRAEINRPLSVFEYYHASVASRPWLKAPRMVTLVLEGEGLDFDPDLWRTAVARVSTENPGLRLRLAGRWTKARWVNDGKPPRVRFLDSTDWDGLSGEGGDFIEAEPLSLSRGETSELILVNQSPRGRLVILRFSHAVMDGRGAIHFLRDLFRAMRGEPLIGSNAGFSDIELMDRLGPRKANLGLIRTDRLTGPPAGNEPGNRWERIVLETRGRNILARVAAIMAEYFHRHSALPALISVPVDIRPRLPGLVASTNFCSWLLVPMNRGDGPDSFRQKLGVMLENRMDLFYPRALRLIKLFSLSCLDLLLAGRMGDCRGRRAAETAMISNFGRLESGEFSCDQFRLVRLFMVPPVNSQVYAMLAGVDDHIELVLGMPKVLASDGRFDDFTAFLRRRLSETEADENAPAPDLHGSHHTSANSAMRDAMHSML